MHIRIERVYETELSLADERRLVALAKELDIGDVGHLLESEGVYLLDIDLDEIYVQEEVIVW